MDYQEYLYEFFGALDIKIGIFIISFIIFIFETSNCKEFWQIISVSAILSIALTLIYILIIWILSPIIENHLFGFYFVIIWIIFIFFVLKNFDVTSIQSNKDYIPCLIYLILLISILIRISFPLLNWIMITFLNIPGIIFYFIVILGTILFRYKSYKKNNIIHPYNYANPSLNYN